MSRIAFRVPGTPRPKERPRFGGGHVRTPRRTADYERAVGMLARAAHRGPALSGPLEVRVVAVWPRPARRPAAVPADVWATGARVPRTGSPDADNVAKAILDGLQLGGAIEDDRHVVRLATSKVYAATGEREGVEVEVEALAWDAA